MKLRSLNPKSAILTVAFVVSSLSMALAAGLSGTYNIYPGAAAPNFTSIANAITSLNANGVAAAVTFNIGVPSSATSYTETITATLSISIPTLPPTVTKTVTFQQNPSNTGANPLITAYTGTNTPGNTTQDGIWRILGADYITIDGIDLKDPNTTGPATMEYGYALYKTSATNGCQNITIKNCVITLNIFSDNGNVGVSPAPVAATGILVTNATATNATAAITVTATTGANSNNRFYTNTIQQCTTGITIFGFASTTYPDTGNDIGGSDVSTGNTIINYGGTVGAALVASGITTGDQQNLKVNYNTIDNNNGGGVNHVSTLRGILINAATSASTTITFNTINLTSAGNRRVVAGIENISGSTPTTNTVNISNNTINGGSFTTATTDVFSGDFYGITNSGSPATLTISNNSVTNTTYATIGTSTAVFYAIFNSGAATTANITSNTITGNSVNGTTTGISAGILNTAACGTLNINSNTVASFATSTATIVIYPISNTGAVTTAININQNNIGTSVLPCFTFSAANSGAQVLINNGGGATGAALSISNNNFYTPTYSVAGSGANTYISNTISTKSQAINNNIFNNFAVNTTGPIIFIANTATLTATGTQNINTNSIAGTFNKTGAGSSVTLYAGGSVTSIAGAVINHNSNNFSAITVTGATAIAGWVYTDAGSPTYTAQNNTFSNWTGGTAAVTAMNINITGNNNSITLNQVNNITAAGTITGITTSAGNDNIFLNVINALTGTSTNACIAISVTGGATQEAYRNKIYDIDNSNALGSVNGILVSAGTAVNIYSNIIGDLKTPAGSGADPIRAINITSTTATSSINVYYNTIYLNATSTATNFGSTGVYHTTNATATTATLNLRNNIISNNSTANGSGFTVAYRRSSNVLTNYGATSNNNLFYAGPLPSQLIFYNGTNSDQTLSAYKTRVSTRDAASITEDETPKFYSIVSTDDTYLYLHISNSVVSAARGAAAVISGFTIDFDGQTRSTTTPDIGADEIFSSVWTGNTSTDWAVAGNWAGGVPTVLSDIEIPAGRTNYPVLTTGTYVAHNLSIRTGAPVPSVTLTGGTLQLSGIISNSGTFTSTNNAGTLELNGIYAQTIPAAFFAGNNVSNLKVNNAMGVTLGGTLNLTAALYPTQGTLTTNDNLTLVSSATQTALIDGAGAGVLVGNVTMQRYLTSGFGYKFFSSPMQAATVASFTSTVSIPKLAADTLDNFFDYTEADTASGFHPYTTTTLPLTPMVGYVANFGSATSAKTVSITGAVNNGPQSVSVYNSGKTYTTGFNLVGNPYPSPIDWNASSGWTKTNVDNALYYFDSGAANRYLGTYSTYINGVSSDGIANNFIASMQGFFVHVSGTPPVSGTLGVTNAVRVNNLTTFFHKSNALGTIPVPRSLVRLSASYSNDVYSADPVVVYTDDAATPQFNKDLDAIKLLNTNMSVPNLYIQKSDKTKLAINALAAIDSNTVIPLSLKLPKDGSVSFTLMTTENIPNGLTTYLYDARIGKHIALKVGDKYSTKLTAGTYDKRFYIVYKDDENIATDADNFYVYRKDGKVYANIRFVNNQPGDLSLIGITGTVVSKQSVGGNGIYDLGSPKVLGVYIINFYSQGHIHAKKIFVPE